MWYKDTGKHLNESEVRKFINNVLKPDAYSWLKEVGSNVMKQGVKDADEALKRFFKKQVAFPKLKKKHKAKPSFYVNYESLKRTQTGFKGEKIGYVKTSEPLPKLPQGAKYKNPRITFDGKYWYLSVGHEIDVIDSTLTPESVGVDVGIKNLATISNIDKPISNINKSVVVRKTKRKLKRKQRQVSKKYEMNKQGKMFIKTKNMLKLENEIRIIYKRLNDIRQNHLHQATNMIVKTKPSRIVVENLNIKGMMKNRYLSKAIAEQKLHEFTRQLEYKSQMHGIEFVKANRWFPSSKTCFSCGVVKKKLSLKERVFKCDSCDFALDRDKNASFNLANYYAI